MIITSRYDFLLPELNQRLHREQLAALSGTDLQKKCNRLVSFAPGSEADIKRELGEPEEALRLYMEALELAEETGDKNLLYGVQNNIATLQVDLGQTDAWDNLLPSLVSHRTQSQNLEDRIQLLSNTASLRFKQGEIEEAGEIFEHLNNLLPQIDNSWLQALVLHNLATLRSECGDRELAWETF